VGHCVIFVKPRIIEALSYVSASQERPSKDCKASAHGRVSYRGIEPSGYAVGSVEVVVRHALLS
jgi:hypothetical protein